MRPASSRNPGRTPAQWCINRSRRRRRKGGFSVRRCVGAKPVSNSTYFCTKRISCTVKVVSLNTTSSPAQKYKAHPLISARLSYKSPKTVRLNGLIHDQNGKEVKFRPEIDNSCRITCIHPWIVTKLRLKQFPLPQPIPMVNTNGSKNCQHDVCNGSLMPHVRSYDLYVDTYAIHMLRIHGRHHMLP